MPGIANRVRKASSARAGPKRGFTPASIGETSDAMYGSLAASAGGLMKPELPSSAFKQRRVEMAEEEKGSVALRTVTYPIFAASTEATYQSEDGSSFTVSTQDAPMHIPGSAAGLSASLINASVPYVWNNLKQDQTLTVSGKFPRRVVLGGDVSIPYSLSLPTSGSSIPSGFGNTSVPYLMDQEYQPFWLSPGVLDSFLDGTDETMGENGKFDGATRWFDKATGQTEGARVARSRTLTINLDSDLTTLGFSAPNLNTHLTRMVRQEYEAGKYVYGTPSSTVTGSDTSFDITIDFQDSSLWNATGEIKVGSTAQFVAETEDTIPGANVTSVSLGTISQLSQPQLSGELQTSSPMIRFGQDSGSSNPHSSNIELPRSFLDAVKSSSFDQQGTNDAHGAFNWIMSFNEELLENMRTIAHTILSRSKGFTAGVTSEIAEADFDQDYQDDCARGIIVLAEWSTDLRWYTLIAYPNPLMANGGFGTTVTEAQSRDGGWFVMMDLQTSNGQAPIRHEDLWDSFTTANMYTTGSGARKVGIPLSTKLSTDATRNTVEDYPGQGYNRMPVHEPLQFTVVTATNTESSRHELYATINVVNDASAASSTFTAPRIQVTENFSDTLYTNDPDGSSPWNGMNLNYFRIGSMPYKVTGHTNEIGNFQNNLLYNTGGGTVWGANSTDAFFLGDLFFLTFEDTPTLTGTSIESGAHTTDQHAFAYGVTLAQLIRDRYNSEYRQLYRPSDADPLTQLPTLSAGSPTEYVTVQSVSKTAVVPRGEFDSVQQYIDAVNGALQESTLAECGVEGLIQLDVDKLGETNGDVDYDLQVHINRPIDGTDNPLLTETITTNGSEPLLNQRLNTMLFNSSFQDDMPKYTRIKSKGDYALLIADSATCGQALEDLLLVHRPSLTFRYIRNNRSPVISLGSSVFHRVVDADLILPESAQDTDDTVIVGLATVYQASAGGNLVYETRVWRDSTDAITTSSSIITLGDPERDEPNAIVGRIAPFVHGTINRAYFVSAISVIRGNDEHNNIIQTTLEYFGGNTNIISSSQADRSETGNTFGALSNYVVQDMKVVGGTFSSSAKRPELLFIMRKASNSASTNYKLVYQRIQISGSDIDHQARVIDATLQSSFENAHLVTGALETNYEVNSYVALAQLAKITLKDEQTQSDLVLTAPRNSNNETVLYVLDTTGTGSFTTFRIKDGDTQAFTIVADKDDGSVVSAMYHESDDHLSVVFSKGKVSDYEITANSITGTGSGNTVPQHTYQYATAPATANDFGTSDAVVGTFQKADGTGSAEEHIFFVGDLIEYNDGTTVEVLTEPHFLHRTSTHQAATQDSIKFFQDQRLPTKVTFDPSHVMDPIWTDTEDDFEEAANYVPFELDMVFGDYRHGTKTYDMFDKSATGVGDPLVTSYSNTSVVLPKGNYTFQTLGRAINELVHTADVDKFGLDTFLFEDSRSLRTLFVGAKLSTSLEDFLPQEVSLSWSSGPFSTLFTQNSITLTAQGASERTYYDGLNYSATGLEAIRTVYLKCNFVQGGMNPQRQKSQILASIPVDKAPGQTLVALPSVPLKVSAENFLNQGDAATDLEFLITDEAGTPIDIGKENPWSVNVLIEWEQDINPARLRQSGSETRHR